MKKFNARKFCCVADMILYMSSKKVALKTLAAIWDKRHRQNKKESISNKEKTHGWTNQKSSCRYACWWDCSFLCTSKKLNPKEELISCKFNKPDFNKCKEKA